jgi:CDP-diacylglycerol---glycerol-3-phosphate 3-phosphatidyltransferase
MATTRATDLNLPNLITLGRIVLAVLLVPLLFLDSFEARLAAFIVFLIAAFSDLWDGHIARSRGLITDLGKLLDPAADKILLVATFVPFYLLSRGVGGGSGPFPWFGGALPLWIVLLIFGRELFITLFRSYAARRGVVIPAGPAGKYKTVFQNIFIGAAILWYALQSLAERGGGFGTFWESFRIIHFSFAVITLSIAVVLTIYSMLVYLWGYRSVVVAGDGSGAR